MGSRFSCHDGWLMITVSCGIAVGQLGQYFVCHHHNYFCTLPCTDWILNICSKGLTLTFFLWKLNKIRICSRSSPHHPKSDVECRFWQEQNEEFIFPKDAKTRQDLYLNTSQNCSSFKLFFSWIAGLNNCSSNPDSRLASLSYHTIWLWPKLLGNLLVLYATASIFTSSFHI